MRIDNHRVGDTLRHRWIHYGQNRGCEHAQRKYLATGHSVFDLPARQTTLFLLTRRVRQR